MDIVMGRGAVRRTLVAVAAAVLVALVASSALAADKKTYTASLAPTTISGDTPFAVTFHFTNTAPNQQLGSIDITIPAGITVTGHTSPIQLRSLAIPPGGSASFGYTVIADCATGTSFTFGVRAKQSNDFAGVGNDFVLEGASPRLQAECIGSPPDPPPPPPPPPATTTTTTTTTTTLPPPPATTTTTTTIAATTTELPRRERVEPAWTWDAIVPCLTDGCTTPVIQFGRTLGQLTGGDNATVLFLAVEAEVVVALDCADFTAQSDLVIFDVWGDPFGGAADKTAAVTLLEAGWPAESFQVCFGADEPFVQADGGEAVFDGTYWVGLLPDCDVAEPWPAPQMAPGDGPLNPPPCVVSRSYNVFSGDVTVVVYAPPGDPLIKIG